MSVFGLSLVIVFAPLLGACLALLFPQKTFATRITILGLLLSFCAVICTWSLFSQDQTFLLLKWLKVADMRALWGIKIDSLSLVMCTIVSLISLLVHIYSLGYMSHDHAIGRFFAYLSFFTFMMLLLVTAPNLAQLFVGWEGVGLASYLLIGFWHHKARPGAAAMKAFIVNRVGDAGFLVGLGLLFALCQSVDFDTLITQFHKLQQTSLLILGQSYRAIDVIGFCLFIGVMGKSAQFGLHTWLPDAMEGPTPVSALIHAATMVTAGIFLLCRLSPLYELTAGVKDIILWVGVITSLFGASVAIAQTDIKKTIAYSTCSQLGYMVCACATGAYGIAIFHLVTHAFFKALLFLGAGSVIHALSGEQQMPRMGGLYKLIPKTYALMWIGSLSIAGIPFFSGYYSKDAILSSLLNANYYYAYAIALCVVFLTAFYSWRLLLLTFHGSSHADEHVLAHVHEAPLTMLFPMIILAFGAIVSGIFGWQWFVHQNGFSWGDALVVAPMSHPSLVFEILPVAIALLGVFYAYVYFSGYGKSFFNQRISTFMKEGLQIDRLYAHLFVRPLIAMGILLFEKIDLGLIDRLGPDGISQTIHKLSTANKKIQTGYIHHYAFLMVATIALILGIYMALKLFSVF